MRFLYPPFSFPGELIQNIYWTLSKSALQFRLSYCTNSCDSFSSWALLTGTQSLPNFIGPEENLPPLSAAWSYFSLPLISLEAVSPSLAWAETLGITLGSSIPRALHPIYLRTVNFPSKISFHLFTFVLSLQPPQLFFLLPWWHSTWAVCFQSFPTTIHRVLSFPFKI